MIDLLWCIRELSKKKPEIREPHRNGWNRGFLHPIFRHGMARQKRDTRIICIETTQPKWCSCAQVCIYTYIHMTNNDNIIIMHIPWVHIFSPRGLREMQVDGLKLNKPPLHLFSYFPWCKFDAAFSVCLLAHHTQFLEKIKEIRPLPQSNVFYRNATFTITIV
jgi:hypothetical protein